jgi:hypothetical protein
MIKQAPARAGASRVAKGGNGTESESGSDDGGAKAQRKLAQQELADEGEEVEPM